MANLRIFEQVAHSHRQPIRMGRFQASQEVAIGAASAQSAALNASTEIVTVQADAACHIVFGTNPTATTAGFKLAAGESADFAVPRGDKLAVIEA